MSNLFLKNSLKNIFDTVTETDVELPQWINIIDQNKESSIKNTSAPVQQGGSKNNEVVDSATSSAFIGQYGGNADSATSSAFIGQYGGNADSATSSAFIGHSGTTRSSGLKQTGGMNESVTSSAMIKQPGNIIDSATSSAFIEQLNNNVAPSTFTGQYGGSKNKKQKGGNNADINKLISMLTSESNNNNNISETTTETLEAQLREILKQDGGKKHNKPSNHEDKIQTAGSNTSIMDIKNFFVNLKSQGVDVNVKLNEKTLSEFFDLAQNTTTEVHAPNTKLNNIIGGAKKNTKKEELLDGGANAGFQAFLDFKKHVANKLKISNGPSAAKIAGSVNTSMKEKYSDLNAVEIAKKNTEYFDKNIDKIKNDFKELIEKNPIKK